jgi:hypothetical protein
MLLLGFHPLPRFPALHHGRDFHERAVRVCPPRGISTRRSSRPVVQSCSRLSRKMHRQARAWVKHTAASQFLTKQQAPKHSQHLLRHQTLELCALASALMLTLEANLERRLQLIHRREDHLRRKHLVKRTLVLCSAQALDHLSSRVVLELTQDQSLEPCRINFLPTWRARRRQPPIFCQIIKVLGDKTQRATFV